MESFRGLRYFVVGGWKPGHRHGLSPVADAPRLQDTEMDGIFSDYLRNTGAGRRTDRLGGDSPRASSIDGRGRRSTFSARWRIVGAHGLDCHRPSSEHWRWKADRSPGWRLTACIIN